MVSRSEDVIDFNKLEEEVNDAVEADAHYLRENDAKFRAVHQKVATYEEFRDIVLASHIKPLEKKDLINTNDFKQPWNIHAAQSTDTEKKKEESTPSRKTLQVIPKNGHEFTKEWRKLNKASQLDKYNLLLELGGDTIGIIFKNEISFGLLGEFIDILHSELKKGHEKDVLHILEQLAKTNRFQLSVDFMSSKEKEMCAQLFHKIQQGIDSDTEVVEKKTQIMKSYNL